MRDLSKTSLLIQLDFILTPMLTPTVTDNMPFATSTPKKSFQTLFFLFATSTPRKLSWSAATEDNCRFAIRNLFPHPTSPSSAAIQTVNWLIWSLKFPLKFFYPFLFDAYFKQKTSSQLSTLRFYMMGSLVKTQQRKMAQFFSRIVQPKNFREPIGVWGNRHLPSNITVISCLPLSTQPRAPGGIGKLCQWWEFFLEGF